MSYLATTAVSHCQKDPREVACPLAHSNIMLRSDWSTFLSGSF